MEFFFKKIFPLFFLLVFLAGCGDDPERAKKHHEAGMFYADKKENVKAEKEFRKAVKKDSSNLKYKYDLAVSITRTDPISEEALELYNYVVEGADVIKSEVRRNKLKFVSHYGMASIYAAREDKDKSFYYLKKCILNVPNVELLYGVINGDPDFYVFKEEEEFKKIMGWIGVNNHNKERTEVVKQEVGKDLGIQE